MHKDQAALQQNNSPTIEKVPSAAKRMCVSVTQVYREAKAGRLTIIKIGPRSSAVSTAEVDKWILDRIQAATKGGE